MDTADIIIRKNTTDSILFKEILLKEQYKTLCTINNVKNIIDAGGNVGYSAIYFASKYPEAKIITIEPDKDNYETLVKNVKNYPNILPIRAALWGSSTNLSVFKDNGLGEWGRQTFEIDDIEQYDSDNTIKSITMKQIIEEFDIPIIDILKIDIEGSEKDVFANNSDFWLPKVRIMGIELHDRMLDGCREVFFDAINKNPFFKIRYYSEDIILYNRFL